MARGLKNPAAFRARAREPPFNTHLHTVRNAIRRRHGSKGSVSDVDMVTPISSIYKMVFSSLSTFETPPAKASAVAPIVLPHRAGSQGRGPPVVHPGPFSPHCGVGSPMPSRSRARIAGPWALSRLRQHPRQRPNLAELLPHLPPRVTCIVAHEQLAVEGAGQHQVGVGWMGRDAADITVRLAG